MPPDNPTNVEKLRSLSRVRDSKVVREELEDAHIADIAEGFQRLSNEEGRSILAQIEPDMAAELLNELPNETARGYLEDLPDSALAHYLDILPMDDAVDLRDVIGEERFDALLNVIPAHDAREIRRLLAYPDGSVGRMITEAFFEVSPESTMSEIIDDIRRSTPEKYETINDLYVLDEDRHLLGVLSLRKVIRGHPDMTARVVMREEVISCEATERAEEAARKMSRYGFFALPVVDSRAKMVGLFTGDDAQYVLRAADTEDVLRLGAVASKGEAYISLNSFQLYQRRIGWLLLLFIAETFTGSVLRIYERELKVVTLAFFIPLIIGAGGNSGSQVTTTITRALAVGEVRASDAWMVMRRELVTATLVGLTLGIVGFLRSQLWHSAVEISWVVGLALPTIVLWSALIGSVLPITARRLGFDPAVMSAPFITTFVDATGLIIYFEIARFIIHIP